MAKFILAGLLSVLFSCFSLPCFSDGICTGYFVSSTGYIITAGHCAGKRLIIYYKKNDQIKRLVAKTIVKVPGQDVLILKINDQNLPYFNLLPTNPDSNTSVMYIGFPEFTRMIKLQSYSGKTIHDWMRYNKLAIAMDSAPGASGSPVFDSNSNVVGTLVAGLIEGSERTSTTTLAVPITNIVKTLILYHIPVHYQMQISEDMNWQTSKYLFNQNKSKIVLIEIRN